MSCSGLTSTIRPRKICDQRWISARSAAGGLDLDQHQVALDVVFARDVVHLDDRDDLLELLADLLEHAGRRPSTTTVIRDRCGFSVSPTARLSMLKPREANMPETWASTPGWFCTRAESTCRFTPVF